MASRRTRPSGSAGGDAYAIRNLLQLVPAARALAQSREARSVIEPVLGSGAFAVRGILFDKTEGANWKVGWHQDLMIAVREKREKPQFSGWSVKAGVAHVHPPASVLEGMLALRVHLDPCGPENGPLKVVPGSHASGKLDAGAIREWRRRVDPVACQVDRGGALLMRPLLLHASSPAVAPGHRRVIHLEFAAEPLPGGLEWHEA
jgi:ectoine hydroxylase-related dioxygenase (phytanoyl-CoA dioxygenase family)